MRSLLYIVIATALLLAAACVRHSESWATLDRADAVMEEHPDSALALLRGIDSSTLNGDEENARYALIKEGYAVTDTFLLRIKTSIWKCIVCFLNIYLDLKFFSYNFASER